MLSLVGPSFAGVLERGGALARGRGASLAAAGGLVRDALLGRASQDVDLLVAGMPAAQLAALLHAEMGHPAKPVLVHEAFHTAVLTLKVSFTVLFSSLLKQKHQTGWEQD